MKIQKTTPFIKEVGTSHEDRHLTFTSKCGRSVLQITQHWFSVPSGMKYNEQPLPGRMKWPCPCSGNKDLCYFSRVTNPTLKVFGAARKK